MSKTYAVNEIFYSLQGEGFYTGTPAVFIRFAGCNLRCPFCDTDFSKAIQMSAAAIVDKCLELIPRFCLRPIVVLTGGEPTLQVDAPLLAAIHEQFPIITMETNGSRPVPDGVDFVTCSPKCDFVGDYDCIPSASEVKVVFDCENDPERWEKRIEAEHYYIQPCDTGDAAKNEQIKADAVRWLLQHPRWRLSLQTQKILNVR